MTTFLTIAVPSALVIASYVLARRKIEQIHLLVNSQLSEALAEVEALKQRFGVDDE